MSLQSRNQLPFTLKYYPPRKLFIIITLVLALTVGVFYLIDVLAGKEWDELNWLLKIAGSYSIPFLVFNFVNRSQLKFVYSFLGVPQVSGTYTGNLISSYHIDDDPTKPHVEKHVKMTIDHNLNGFVVTAWFSDNDLFEDNITTRSVSFTHDLQVLARGNFELVYQYENTGNFFHKDQQRVGFNRHGGISIMEYNPIDKTLEGRYYINDEDRMSHGKMKLKLAH